MVIVFLLVLVVPFLVIVLLEFCHPFPNLGHPFLGDHLLEFYTLFPPLVILFLMVALLELCCPLPPPTPPLVVPFLVIFLLELCCPLPPTLVVHFLVILLLEFCCPFRAFGHPLLGDLAP